MYMFLSADLSARYYVLFPFQLPSRQLTATSALRTLASPMTEKSFRRGLKLRLARPPKVTILCTNVSVTASSTCRRGVIAAKWRARFIG